MIGGWLSSSSLSRGVSYLFAQGEVGGWYDPSDLSTLFQDAVGTTPVTAAGQVVGLMLDKSGRGNHASQTTTASKPILAKVPYGGRRNPLTYTEQLDNAAWVKSNATVSPNVYTAPDGTLTADLVAVSASGYVRQEIAVVTSAGSVWVKRAPAGSATAIRIATNNTVAWATGYGAKFTLTDQWQRISANGSLTSGTTTRFLIGAVKDTDGQTDPDCVGNVLIWGAQLEAGSTATAYQKVVSTHEVTEAGKADCHYLAFDGVDDYLVTPTITPGTDKVQVFAGVRKLSDAAPGSLMNMATSIENGSIEFLAPLTAGTYRFASRGTVEAFALASGFAAPVTSVLAGISNISADSVITRVNGAQSAIGTSDQGTGNYGNYPMHIGRRNGASIPFNGSLYGLIIRFGANLSAAQIARTEAWMKNKTGAY